MKKFLKRLLIGFSLSTVVAICVHLRGNAIQQMSPISVPEDRSGAGMSQEDFVNDIMRIRDEVYDPIKPVAEEGSFLLKLEMAAYASPVILVSSAMSPSFLPAFAYSEQFRQDHRRRLPLGATLPDDIAGAAQAEGLAWGVAQGVAFYLPFFAGRRRKVEDADSRSRGTRHTTPEAEAQKRTILDSAIDKCDD